MDYCKYDMLGATLNPFDASLAVATLCLLRYPTAVTDSSNGA